MERQSVILLHSGRYHRRWATHSVRGEPRAWFRYTADSGSAMSPGAPTPTRPLTGRLWTDLRNLLNDPRFGGRWFGYFSYDLARLIEPGKLDARRETPADWPLVELAWCPDARSCPPGVEGLTMDASPLEARPSSLADSAPVSNFSREAYISAVRRVLGYIAAGDVFQVNLAQRFAGSYGGDPRALFGRLAATSPAWYGAYLELPGGRAILSTSPELFLRVRDRRVVTRPIKGTLPGDADPEALRDSAKDAAELNMIVDLMRNDLGRVCAYGSVRVSERRAIESHPTIHHGVATVEGELHPSKDVVDLLRATLPGGSVTGAPKVRAMQIIDELEPHPRGPYCGAIGYIAADELHLSIAIRTMLLTGEAYSFSVGGGIVADSDPDAEYEETLAKARPMLEALRGHRPGPAGGSGSRTPAP